MSKHIRKLPEHSRSIPSKRRREATFASEKALQPLAPSTILQRAALAPESLRPAEVVRMQQTLGNRAVGGLLNQSSSQRPLIQAKLTVNAPGDEYEQEADRMAEEVMRMPAVQRAELEDEDEEPEIMTKREPAHAAGGAFEAGEAFEQQLGASQGQGQPLLPSLREEFEAKFGADFSGVRVHADNQSAEMNRAIQARAFTTGQDMFFGQGAYDPGSRGGQALIAHELTHVVQQVGEQIQPKEEGKQPVSTKTIPAKSIGVTRLSFRRNLIQPKYLDHPQGLRSGLTELRNALNDHSDKAYCKKDDMQKLLKVLIQWATESREEYLNSAAGLVRGAIVHVKNIRSELGEGEIQSSCFTNLSSN
jgi:uncharacterized protein DUF4157